MSRSESVEANTPTEVTLDFLQRVCLLVDLEDRHRSSDRTVWQLHIKAVRARLTPEDWALIRSLSDGVRREIPGAHTVTPKEHKR